MFWPRPTTLIGSGDGISVHTPGATTSDALSSKSCAEMSGGGGLGGGGGAGGDGGGEGGGGGAGGDGGGLGGLGGDGGGAGGDGGGGGLGGAIIATLPTGKRIKDAKATPSVSVALYRTAYV